MQSIVGKRLKAAREEAGLTQKQLSERLGIKDRQTVAAMEAGQRKVTAEELIAAMQILGRDLDYFTDPFRLDGEGRFSWRTSAEDTSVVADFEADAGRWLATFRELVEGAESKTVPLHLDLTKRSSYEDAHAAAEWLVHEWSLGETPARSLEAAIETRLRALVLYVDAPAEVSGAAFKLPGLSAILINRNEAVGRCSFDLAHELFHLLTWETMPPAYAEAPGVPGSGLPAAGSLAATPAAGRKAAKAGRVEQLANCFASALLMPEQSTRAVWKQAPAQDAADWTSWLNDTARRYRVSTAAFQWRLVQLGVLEKDAVNAELRWDGDAAGDRGDRGDRGDHGDHGDHGDRGDHGGIGRPELFSRGFVEAVNGAIGDGKVSVRRAAELLDLSIDDMAGLFQRHGLEPAFDV